MQGRTEALGAAIAAVCIATPSMQARLKQMQPGRVQARSGGAGGAFMLGGDLSDDQRKVPCRALSGFAPSACYPQHVHGPHHLEK